MAGSEGSGRTRQLFSQPSELWTTDDEQENTNLSGVRRYNEHQLVLTSGYDQRWLLIWQTLENLHITYGVRAKASSLQNHTHDPIAVMKDIDYAQKTAPVEEAERGHLAIRDQLSEFSPAPEADQTYFVRYHARDGAGNLKYNQDGSPKMLETFATFERQTINSILLQIYDKRYNLEEVNLGDAANGEHPYIILRDNATPNPRKFKVTFDPADFREGLHNVDGYSSVSSRTMKYERLRQQNSSVRPIKESSDNLTLLEEMLQANRIDVSKTVRLMRYENGLVNKAPHIVCDSKGTPVKGDVDTEFMWTPLTMPPQSLALANVFEGKGGLIAQLVELKKQLAANRQENIGFMMLIDKAITNLQGLEPHKADKRVELLGNITLFNAAIVLAFNSSVRHGEEAYSPVKKENVVQTHIPDPNHKGKFIVAHNEYELVQTQMTLPHNGYRLFNPTMFVAGDWRKDLPASATKSWAMGEHNHRCNNKTDEKLCIALHKLHFKQHLLEVKLQFLHHPGKYREYMDVMRDNYRQMLTDPRRTKDKSPEFLQAWKEGIAEMGKVALVVNKYNSEQQINRELDKIKKQARTIQQPKVTSAKPSKQQPTNPGRKPKKLRN